MFRPEKVRAKSPNAISWTRLNQEFRAVAYYQMQLSLVTTLYRSAPYLNEFYARLSTTAKEITPDYELILVNDGSPDNSLEISLELLGRDPRIKIIDLSRNFGHHEAIMTGLKEARGDYVFLIDSDLEEAPELLLSFWRELESSTDTDMVYGVQEKRKGGWLERSSGHVFYFVFNKLSRLPIPENALTVRLMTKRFLDTFVRYDETHLFLAGILEHAGFCKKAIPVKKRSKGKRSYTLSRQFRLFIESITSFSSLPLEYMLRLGFLIALVSFLVASYVFITKLIYQDILAGWVAVMISIWFIGGVLMMFTGVLGIYLGKVFEEVKRRPRTVIKQIYSANK